MKEEFSLTWEVEGNAPQLKRRTLLHVRRKIKRGGRARDTNKSHVHAHVFLRVYFRAIFSLSLTLIQLYYAQINFLNFYTVTVILLLQFLARE
jgi:hypothetical protein